MTVPERSFDHIVMSHGAFSVDDAGYDHTVRGGDAPISDHSIVHASLRLDRE
jgi:hypothetical protein